MTNYQKIKFKLSSVDLKVFSALDTVSSAVANGIRKMYVKKLVRHFEHCLKFAVNELGIEIPKKDLDQFNEDARKIKES